MLRILWKAEALKDPSVVKASEEALKKLGEENDSLVKEKELNNKIAAESLASAKADYNRARNIAMILIGIALLAGIAMLLLLASIIASPIKAAVEHTRLMAGGDFTREVSESFLRRRDEMGQLAHAFAEMNSKIRALLKKWLPLLPKPARPARNSLLPWKKSASRDRTLMPRWNR